MRSSTLAVCAMTLATRLALAHDAVPLPMPPPPGDGMPATQVQVHGRVARLLVNPNGNVDGFLLTDGSQVAVPPPAGEQLARNLSPGESVIINGSRAGDAPVIAATSIQDGSRELIPASAEPPARLPAPPALQPMQAAGTVTQPLYGPRGEINGVLLSDGTSVRLPPPAVQLQPGLFKAGAAISARGFGVSTAYGRSIQAAAMGSDAGNEQRVMPAPRPGDTPPPPPPPASGGAAG